MDSFDYIIVDDDCRKRADMIKEDALADMKIAAE